MIRNRYNYPTPPILDIKGKETQPRNNWTLMETSLAESQTDSYFPTKWPNGYPKQKDVSDTHIQRRTLTKINHDRRTALERSVKSISLRGLNRFYVATILALIVSELRTNLPSFPCCILYCSLCIPFLYLLYEGAEMVNQRRGNTKRLPRLHPELLQIHKSRNVTLTTFRLALNVDSESLLDAF